jgi:hypothetical protein
MQFGVVSDVEHGQVFESADAQDLSLEIVATPTL